MTASTQVLPSLPVLATSNMTSMVDQHSSVSVLKSTLMAEKDAARARRASFVSMRRLSGSFSKQRCSHNRKVSFDLEANEVHPLPKIEDSVRPLLWVTYLDKVSSADDVEETCYNFNDTDFVHPYVQQLDAVWDQCGKSATKDKDSACKPLALPAEDLTKLVSGKGRGLEKKLIMEMKKHRETVLKSVLETQKSYKNVPLTGDQKAKLLRNKYKKLSVQSKVFALTVAEGDAQIASELQKGNTVAATSA